MSLYTGLRIGEVLALCWGDIDLDNNPVTVRRSISRVQNYDKNPKSKTKLIEQEPKTEKGKRTVPIPDDINSILACYNWDEFVKGKGTANDLVFHTEPGNYIEPRNLMRTFYNLVEKAEIDKKSFHSLRRSYATRLLEENEHPKVVQELLGHSSISMTMDIYSHVAPQIKSKLPIN